MQANPPATSSFNIQNLGNPTTVLFESPVDMSRMMYMLYQDIEIQINRADLKAQIVLSTTTVLAALAVNAGLGSAVLQFSSLTGMEWAAMVLYALCAVSLCGALGFAVSAAYPRAVRHPEQHAANPSLYFSADLIRIPPDEYVKRFCSQTNEDLKESILKQIHVKSQVLEAKLRYVRRGLRALVAAILCWGLAHGALFLAYGTLLKV